MAAHEVARAVEAVRREDPPVVVGGPVVAAQRVGPAHRQFADLPVGDVPALLVGEADFVVNTHRDPHGLEANLLGVVSMGEEQRSLAHPKVLLDKRVGKGPRQAPSHLRLEALATRLQQLNRGQDTGLSEGIRQPPDIQRRHRGDVGHRVPLDGGQDIRSPSAGPQHDHSSLQEHPLNAGTRQRHVVRQRKNTELHRTA